MCEDAEMEMNSSTKSSKMICVLVIFEGCDEVEGHGASISPGRGQCALVHSAWRFRIT